MVSAGRHRYGQEVCGKVSPSYRGGQTWLLGMLYGRCVVCTVSANSDGTVDGQEYRALARDRPTFQI